MPAGAAPAPGTPAPGKPAPGKPAPGNPEPGVFVVIVPGMVCGAPGAAGLLPTAAGAPALPLFLGMIGCEIGTNVEEGAGCAGMPVATALALVGELGAVAGSAPQPATTIALVQQHTANST